MKEYLIRLGDGYDESCNQICAVVIRAESMESALRIANELWDKKVLANRLIKSISVTAKGYVS